MSRARDTANQINRVNSSAADATAITVDSSENVGIGNSSSGYIFTTGETRLSVGDGTEHAGIQVLSGTNKWGGIEFADDTTGGNAQGLIAYYHPDNYMHFKTNGSERLRILSGGGITFNGDTAAANALNDYETGTFTPIFAGSGSNPTVSYAIQLGTYVKIGKLVYVNVSVVASGTPSGGSGDLIIASLPFTSKSGVQQAGSIAFANNISFGNSATQGYCNIEGGVSYLNINSQEFVGTSSMNRVPTSGIQNSSPRIVCSICYETA